MGQPRTIIHEPSGRTLLANAKWCDRYFPKMRGFTFRRSLAPGEALVLVEKKDDRLRAGITMWFVPFDLGVIWVNHAGRIVDKTVARRWRASYLPKAPARFVIEAAPSIVDAVSLGDVIRFEPAP